MLAWKGVGAFDASTYIVTCAEPPPEEPDDEPVPPTCPAPGGEEENAGNNGNPVIYNDNGTVKSAANFGEVIVMLLSS